VHQQSLLAAAGAEVMLPVNLLEISDSGVPGWRVLPYNVRWHVGAFPGGSTRLACASRIAWLVQPRLPGIRMDITDIATRLAVAFPRLLRRVTAVAIDGPIVVQIECEGVHEGMWGDVVSPTWRRVAFEEKHEIVARGGRILSDQITIDVHNIMNQLCDNDGIDPDETTRLGRAAREARARLAARR
jgi:hypothetical protein